MPPFSDAKLGTLAEAKSTFKFSLVMAVGTAVHSFLMEPAFKPKIQTHRPGRQAALTKHKTARATLKNHMSSATIVGLGV